MRRASALELVLVVTSALDAMAQVRPTPMENPDSNTDIMIGRETAGYFIGGFLLLIILIVLRNNHNQKRKVKEQKRKHQQHMNKLKEERLQAVQKPPSQD